MQLAEPLALSATSSREADFAYLAALIDGEGSLNIKRHKYSGLLQGTVSHSFEMCISNTHKGVLERLTERFGGKVYSAKRQKAHHKPCWHWKIAGKEAVSVLRCAFPYMIIKRAQAHTVMLFAKTYTESRWRHSDSVLTKAGCMLREFCYGYLMEQRQACN